MKLRLVCLGDERRGVTGDERNRCFLSLQGRPGFTGSVIACFSRDRLLDGVSRRRMKRLGACFIKDRFFTRVTGVSRVETRRKVIERNDTTAWRLDKFVWERKNSEDSTEKRVSVMETVRFRCGGLLSHCQESRETCYT